ncbi:hypothetical protein OIDMADRAFT_158232 [Oidiodendron maius Zn]|uniref:Uncharacterized protein n=1 Tax=Oidiodendron maius (strain Zn) TaxID=913774 RepID=A0A0C3HMK0_OIDMZ|nr:hypothetical protein OIDMADRAFT_158232 [Oidiodendron maius Zn]
MPGLWSMSYSRGIRLLYCQKRHLHIHCLISMMPVRHKILEICWTLEQRGSRSQTSNKGPCNPIRGRQRNCGVLTPSMRTSEILIWIYLHSELKGDLSL